MEKINWYGTYTLTKREVMRFVRVYNQTIFTPMISALIFLAVFVLSLSKNVPDINGISFANFMGYGMITMSTIQNAFANSSSSFVMSKMLGYISDILTPSIGSTEIIIAYTMGSILRGTLVGIAVTIALSPFIEFNLYHPFLLIFYVLASCSLLGQLGILSGLITRTYEQLSAITSYIVTPLSFLSGTFYSIKSLPLFLQKINLGNPFFYMSDGFRYCITDKSEGSVIVGTTFLITANVILYILLTNLINKGWRIKT